MDRLPATSPFPSRRPARTRAALVALGLAGAALAVAAPAGAQPARPASFPGHPNGRIVLDVSLPDGHDQIVAVNPDGNRLTPLTDGSADDLGPDVSADGTRVAFSSDRSGTFQIWTMDIDGTDLHQVTDPADGQAYYPAWSPDGTTLAYRLTTPSDLGDIAVIPAAGGTPTRLTDSPGLDSLPEWSPDGTHIAFHSARDDADPTACPGACVEAVYVMAADGSDQTRVAYDPGGQDRFPNWSPDGKSIIYEHWDSTAGNSDSHLWTVHADGTDPAPFAPAAAFSAAYAPDYSPNGKLVVWSEYGAVYTAPVAGGPVTTIVPNDSFYALSPDWSVAPALLQTATIAVTLKPTAPVWGQPVTLRAKVTGTAGSGPVSGTVTFRQGTTMLAAPVGLTAKGTAALTVSSLEPFGGTLGATYDGDRTHTTAVGYAPGNVGQASTTTTVSVADGATIAYGDAVKVHVRTVAPSRGAVYDDDASVVVDGTETTSAHLTHGNATLAATDLPVGDHTIQVCAPNAVEYTGSCSATVDVSVVQGTGRLTLHATPATVAVGKKVTVTAQLTPVDSGAVVDVHDGDADLGTFGVDASGTARFTWRPGTSGDHHLTATFAGDADLAAASSPEVVVTVS